MMGLREVSYLVLEGRLGPLARFQHPLRLQGPRDLQHPSWEVWLRLYKVFQLQWKVWSWARLGKLYPRGLLGLRRLKVMCRPSQGVQTAFRPLHQDLLQDPYWTSGH